MQGPPPSPSKAEIAHYLAIGAAEGLDVPQSWTKALDLLQRSAELGAPLAAAELAGLSGDWAWSQAILAGEAPREAQWSRVRNSIDLAKWLEPARIETVSGDPRVVVVEQIAPSEMCDWVIARARARLKPAKITNPKTGESVLSSARTCESSHFRRPDSDIIFSILRYRIAMVTGMQVDAMEIPYVLAYSVGQEFQPHFDLAISPDAPDYQDKLAKGGQRVLTFLLYLNDDYDGGETEFPVLGASWKGRKGEGLFWSNVTPDGALDERTLHAGRPVLRGQKWMLTQWILSRPQADAPG